MDLNWSHPRSLTASLTDYWLYFAVSWHSTIICHLGIADAYLSCTRVIASEFTTCSLFGIDDFISALDIYYCHLHRHKQLIYLI
jgi:hypothetical protein